MAAIATQEAEAEPTPDPEADVVADDTTRAGNSKKQHDTQVSLRGNYGRSNQRRLSGSRNAAAFCADKQEYANVTPAGDDLVNDVADQSLLSTSRHEPTTNQQAARLMYRQW